jgi:hydrogenase/urease accessory protein HupE
MAHGIELNGAQSLSTMGGFIAATALLHAAGVAVAKILWNQPVNFYRALGATLSMIGCGLLLGL